jgi:hypothetical protein
LEQASSSKQQQASLLSCFQKSQKCELAAWLNLTKNKNTLRLLYVRIWSVKDYSDRDTTRFDLL